MSKHTLLKSSWFSFLETQYRVSVRTESCRLDGILSDRKTAGVATQNQDVLRFPVSKVLQARVFQFFLVCTLILSLSIPRFVLQESGIKGTDFRFTPIGQNGSSASLPKVTSLQIKTACPLLEPCSTTTSETTVTIACTKGPVEMSGFSYDLGKAADNFPSGWLVEMKSAPNMEFEILSQYRSQCSQWTVPQQSNATIGELEWDTVPRTSLLLVIITLIIGSASTLLFSWNRRILMARRSLTAAVSVLAGISLATVFICFSTADKGRALWWASAAIAFGFLVPFIGFVKLEQFLGPACIPIGAIALVLQIVAATVSSISCNSHGPGAGGAGNFALSIVYLLFGITLTWNTWRRQHRMRERQKTHTHRLQQAWEELLREDENSGELLSLIVEESEWAKSLPRVLQGYPAQQAFGTTSRTFPFKEEGSKMRLQVLENGTKIVQSLDQLYALAAGTSRLLQEKVQSLALVHQGKFPLERPKRFLQHPDQRFVLWSEGVKSLETQKSVYWAPLKPEKRALDKVLGKYAGQPARLLDVCRESIVFDSLASLRHALLDLYNDTDIEVVQVKNYMDPALEVPSGYRAVVLKLRFLSATAQCLGLQCHICELQLLLSRIALCLTVELHEDYVISAAGPTAAAWISKAGARVAPAEACFLPPSQRMRAAPPSGWLQSDCHDASISSPPQTPQAAPSCAPAETSIWPAVIPTVPVSVVRHEPLPEPPRAVEALAPAPRTALPGVPEPGPPSPRAASAELRTETAEAESTRRGADVEDRANANTFAVGQSSESSEKLSAWFGAPGHAWPHPRGPDRLPARPLSLEDATVPQPPQQDARLLQDATVTSLQGPRFQLGSGLLQRQGSDSDTDTDTDAGASMASRKSWTGSTTLRSAAMAVVAVVRRRSTAMTSQLQPSPTAGRQSMGNAWPAEWLGPAETWSALPAEVLLEQYRVRTMLLGPEEMHEHAPTLRESVDLCGAMSAFSTSFPIAAAMRKNVFPVFWTLVGIAALISLRDLPQEFGHLQLRVTALQLRGPLNTQVHDRLARVRSSEAMRCIDIAVWWHQPTAPIIDNLRLLRHACELEVEAVSRVVSPDWREYSLSFEASVEFDTVKFDTPAHSDPAFDPVAFSVEVLSDDGEVWAEVAASSVRVDHEGITHPLREPRSIPQQRGAEVTVHLRVFAYRLLGDVGTWMMVPFALAVVLCSLFHKYELGRPLTLMALFLISLQLLLAAICRTVFGMGIIVALTQYFRASASFCAVYWIYHREWQIIETIFAIGVLKFVDVALHVFVVDKNPDSLVANPPLPTIVVPLLCFWVLVLKRRAQHAALAKISDDVKLYDAVWDDLMATAGERDGCGRIAAALAALNLGHGHRLHQAYPTAAASLEPGPHAHAASTASSSTNDSKRLVKRSQSFLATFGRRQPRRGRSRRRLSAHDPEKHVATLGLLFRQAAGVYYPALHKIREWCEAAPAGGMLPYKGLDGSLGYVQLKRGGKASEGVGKMAAVLGDEEENEWWKQISEKLPPLKRVGRASQKLMRAYAADASRVLDVCRFSLVVDHTWELADLLERICHDEEVEVLGAKNRLREDYNSEQSAGFRDVHLSLAIITPQAEHLGISAHIWELQLMITPMSKVRNDGGHRRYVEYRDARAE